MSDENVPRPRGRPRGNTGNGRPRRFSPDDPAVVIRLPAEELESIKAHAHANEREPAQQIRFILREWLRAQGTKVNP